MAISRRQFLQLGVACTVARFMNATYDLRILMRPELLDLLGPGSVREIGRRYRELVPTESQINGLRAVLLAQPSALRRQVRDDFARGRTILVDGWLLSVTEARQCALFSLLSA